MKHHKGMRDGILLENSNDRYNELYTKNIYIYIHIRIYTHTHIYIYIYIHTYIQYVG